MAKIKFTAGRVLTLECESKTLPAFFWDSTAPGLGLRITPKGSKAYIFQTKLNGKVLRITIGNPKSWTLSAAQAEASRLRVIVDGGKDPRVVRADQLALEAESRQAKQMAIAAENERTTERSRIDAFEQSKLKLTARMVWDDYLGSPHPKWGAQHLKDHIIASNNGGVKAKIGNKETKAGPLASLLARPLCSIDSTVVHDWLKSECENRPTFAHNCFRKFRTFINWCAASSKYSAYVNPACCSSNQVRDIVPRHKTKEGDSLQREQLAAWFEAVNAISNPVISVYLQGLLITGARREELATLMWKDVDFHWRSLTIRDKIAGTRVIPLTPYLSALLGMLPRRSEWVFSSTTAASGHLAEPRIAHTKALAVAGLPHVSLHGLRRSFGTLCEWVEVPTGISAQIMGHKPSALAEKHYRRRPLDLLRKWHDQIESWILLQANISLVDQIDLPKLVAVSRG
jgi:integrase